MQPAPGGAAPPLVLPPRRFDPRLDDGNVDRVLLVPTAETHPEGTWYLSSYEIVFLQVGYALSDRTQISLGVFPDFFSRDPLVPLDLTLKTVVARAGRARVAALVSATGLVGYQNSEALIGRAGGVVELCMDDACRSTLSSVVDFVLAGSVVLADGIGAVVRTGDHFGLLMEVNSVVPLARDIGQINAIGGGAGVRFFGHSWGIDLAVGGPLDRRTRPQLLPWLAATYRFLP
jgi:hypothetical protein